MGEIDNFDEICEELYQEDADLLMLDSYLMELFESKNS